VEILTYSYFVTRSILNQYGVHFTMQHLAMFPFLYLSFTFQKMVREDAWSKKQGAEDM